MRSLCSVQRAEFGFRALAHSPLVQEMRCSVRPNALKGIAGDKWLLFNFPLRLPAGAGFLIRESLWPCW